MTSGADEPTTNESKVREEPVRPGSGTQAEPGPAATIPIATSPNKGFVYEAAIHLVLEEIAALFGDQYVDTSKTTGRIAQCKKGDALLTLADEIGVTADAARVVIEMSDADEQRRDWPTYLEDAQRNRGAQVSLGLVRRKKQVPGGRGIRIYGFNRIVFAFDPSVDDVDLLHCVIAMLRNRAIFERARSGGAHITVAQDRLAHAERLRVKLSGLRTEAARARKLTDKIAEGLDGLDPRLARALNETREALEDSPSEGVEPGGTQGA